MNFIFYVYESDHSLFNSIITFIFIQLNFSPSLLFFLVLTKGEFSTVTAILNNLILIPAAHRPMLMSCVTFFTNATKNVEAVKLTIEAVTKIWLKSTNPVKVVGCIQINF